MPAIDLWDDGYKHLLGFPDSVLRDIARNESAQRDYRLKAVELLVSRKSPYAKHDDLAPLVHDLELELDGIEFEHPAPSGPGPLEASVTTETMMFGVTEHDPVTGHWPNEDVAEDGTVKPEAIAREIAKQAVQLMDDTPPEGTVDATGESIPADPSF